MKMLIIQTGDATTGARHLGNFEDWFKKPVPKKCTHTVHVHRGESLPEANLAKSQYSHIIISGSPAMVTEHLPWMTRTQHWLAKCIEDIPTLGVCFGHQLLADLLGGQVDYNPKGRNMGHDTCQLNDLGLLDSLFHNCHKPQFDTWVSHSQSVIQLPESCDVLASSDKDKNHVFRYQKHVYGVQFHPEWDSKIMQAYIQDRKQVLIEEGLDVDKMSRSASLTREDSSLIHRFVNYIEPCL